MPVRIAEEATDFTTPFSRRRKEGGAAALENFVGGPAIGHPDGEFVVDDSRVTRWGEGDVGLICGWASAGYQQDPCALELEHAGGATVLAVDGRPQHIAIEPTRALHVADHQQHGESHAFSGENFQALHTAESATGCRIGPSSGLRLIVLSFQAGYAFADLNSRDLTLILTARALRAFGFGIAAVLVGLQLERRGLRPDAVGLTLTIGLLAAAVWGIVFAAAAALTGRRTAIFASGLLMALTGLDLALATPHWLLLLAGVTGMLGAASVDLGPFAALEQAVLADAVAPRRRNVAFARYSLAAGLSAAAGSLVAGLANSPGGLTEGFMVYSSIGLVCALTALGLSGAVETAQPTMTIRRANFNTVGRLTALFALDSLGGGFVVQAVIAYWLHIRFGAGAAILGPTFAGIALLQAVSYEVAGRLANRIGLVRTMVFTHLPSNVLLVLVPLMPSLPLAIATLLARFSISQMDVPARQAYVVSIVPPPERAGAAAVTGAVRGLAQAAGPGLAGAAIQTAALGVPFFVAGSLKIVYDLLLYIGFRRRRAAHELGLEAGDG